VNKVVYIYIVIVAEKVATDQSRWTVDYKTKSNWCSNKICYYV